MRSFNGFPPMIHLHLARPPTGSRHPGQIQYQVQEKFPSWRNLTQWGPFLPKEGGMIQVDISGLPPIPFGFAASILSVSQLQHNLLFLAGFRNLNTRSRFGDLMIQVDIGGHPPSPFEPPPSVISVCKF